MPGDPRLGADARVHRARSERVADADAHQHQRQPHRTATRSPSSGRSRRSAPGTFTVGPPSVAVGGARFAGAAVQDPRRARGTGAAAPRRGPPQPMQSPFGFSPFDPWKALIPGFDGLDQAPSPPAPPPTTDPKLVARCAAGQRLLPARDGRQDERGRRRAGHLQRLRVPRRERVRRRHRRGRARRAGRRLREAPAPCARTRTPFSPATRPSAGARGS